MTSRKCSDSYQKKKKKENAVINKNLTMIYSLLLLPENEGHKSITTNNEEFSAKPINQSINKN